MFYRWLNYVNDIIHTEEPIAEDLSWSAYHASKQKTEKESDISVLLPLFQEDSKSVAMIKHGMDVVKQATDYINVGQTPVIAFDQPLFALAKKIQWNWKQIYGKEKFVIMMGALHIEMAVLKTLGDLLEDSGWCNLLVDADIASSGKAESFLHASHVTRTRYSHQVTVAALHCLLNKAYEEYLLHGGNDSFEVWKKKKEKDHPQFQYWSKVMNFQLVMLTFVRSIRSGDFELYKSSIRKLLPWFFSFDHIHYARWLSVHLCDMLSLQETNPDVYSHFQEGLFVVQKTKRAFSSIGIDHAHEQNNKCVKGDGGKSFWFLLIFVKYAYFFNRNLL